MRKLLVGVALVASLVAVPTAAWAHDCANASRPAGSPGEEKGRWVFIPGPNIWAFDNPSGFGGNSGHSDVLLDGTGACSEARLSGQTQGTNAISDVKGIWSQECFLAAGGEF